MKIGGIMFLKHTGKALALFGLLLASGCSSMGGAGSHFPAAGNHPFKIESIPAGADVYVMGEKIGVTPVMLTRKDVFPNIYPGDKVSVYGRVTLKKAGCADYTTPVSAEISNNGLRAKLECAAANPASFTESSPAPSAEAPRITVEQRLDKINELLHKGLITEEEAKKARERILNEL
jgi:hypothetical protein